MFRGKRLYPYKSLGGVAPVALVRLGASTLVIAPAVLVAFALLEDIYCKRFDLVDVDAWAYLFVRINEDFELDEFLKTTEVLLFAALNGNEI